MKLALHNLGLLFLAALLIFTAGCSSIRRAAFGAVADMLSGPSAMKVFMKDDDPELVRESLPVALKTLEALLEADPANAKLLRAAGSGFTLYANAFVMPEAERLEEADFKAAEALKRRAVKLFLRGRDHSLAALEQKIPGLQERLPDDASVLLEATADEVPDLFYAGAAWAGAISANPMDLERLATLPTAEALVRRALELNPAFGSGMIHEFFIAFEGARIGAMGGDEAKARHHFEQAVALSEGKAAGPYVAYASSVLIKKQDYPAFKDLLDKALAVDPKALPQRTLSNVLAQEKARWLMEHSEDLFLTLE